MFYKEPRFFSLEVWKSQSETLPLECSYKLKFCFGRKTQPFGIIGTFRGQFLWQVMKGSFSYCFSHQPPSSSFHMVKTMRVFSRKTLLIFLLRHMVDHDKKWYRTRPLTSSIPTSKVWRKPLFPELFLARRTKWWYFTKKLELRKKLDYRQGVDSFLVCLLPRVTWFTKALCSRDKYIRI